MWNRTDPGVLTQIPWIGLGASRSLTPAMGKETGKMRDQEIPAIRKRSLLEPRTHTEH